MTSARRQAIAAARVPGATTWHVMDAIAITTRTTPVTLRTTVTAMLVAAVAVGAGGCVRQLGDLPAEVETPDTTPFIEPVSPPATGVDRPDEEPGEEGGVPEDDPVGAEDGEETGIGDEPDEPSGREDQDT